MQTKKKVETDQKRLDEQAVNKALGNVQDPVHGGHLLVFRSFLGLLLLCEQDAWADARPNVDLAGAQEQLPAAIVHVGIPAGCAVDLPDEVEREHQRSSEVLLEKVCCVRGSADRLKKTKVSLPISRKYSSNGGKLTKRAT